VAKFTFTAGWKSTLLLLVVIPIFLSLGTWQLQRAEEKEQIVSLYAERESMLPITLSEAENITDKTQLQVKITGQYTDKHFLLENQWRNSHIGLDIVSVFELDSGEMILLNRGWIANEDRRIQPEFDTPQVKQKYQVTIYQPSKQPYSLGQLDINSKENIQRLSYMDIEKISAALNTTFYPYELRIVGSGEGIFDTKWPLINVKPETHVGYAVQWYLFAVIALLVYLFANSNLAQVIRNKD
jgi:cytochrome oxidase assembly protein ShyY1